MKNESVLARVRRLIAARFVQKQGSWQSRMERRTHLYNQWLASRDIAPTTKTEAAE
jgi:hypothetical protein